MQALHALSSTCLLVVVAPATSLNYKVNYWENLWPGGRVYYEISYHTDNDYFYEEFYPGFVRNTMLLEEYTCLRFMRRRWKTKRSFFAILGNYVIYGAVTYGDFPYYFVSPYQDRFGELLLQLGLEYEQKRKDRDNYIIAHYDEIPNWLYFAYNKTDKWPPKGVKYPPYSTATKLHFKFDKNDCISRCTNATIYDDYEWHFELEADRVNAVYDIFAEDIKARVTNYDFNSHKFRTEDIIVHPATPVCRSPGFLATYRELPCEQ